MTGSLIPIEAEILRKQLSEGRPLDRRAADLLNVALLALTLAEPRDQECRLFDVFLAAALLADAVENLGATRSIEQLVSDLPGDRKRRIVAACAELRAELDRANDGRG